MSPESSRKKVMHRLIAIRRTAAATNARTRHPPEARISRSAKAAAKN